MRTLFVKPGDRYSKLTVLNEFQAKDKNGISIRMVECLCDCGNTTKTRLRYVISGNTNTCGCEGSMKKLINGEYTTKHNLSKSRIYNIWIKIKNRCFNPKNVAYKDYGGRGITMCSEWFNDFESFNNWSIKNGYTNKLQIDRIDNNGNYDPSNCRWVTEEINANKRRSTFYIDVSGDKKPLKYYLRSIGLAHKYSLFYRRLTVNKESFETIKNRVYDNTNTTGNQ